MKRGQLLIGGFGCLVFLLSASAGLKAQPSTVKATGNLTFASHYSGGSAPQYGFKPKPLDYTSNSRLDVTYGKARFAAILAKPTTFNAPGQPDRH
ncbi:MAG: hypothetical protein R3282_03550, partial [Rhodothermales bacterium]|nr:hypothetical protein [Rhodothermales bacterium]